MALCIQEPPRLQPLSGTNLRDASGQNVEVPRVVYFAGATRMILRLGSSQVTGPLLVQEPQKVQELKWQL